MKEFKVPAKYERLFDASKKVLGGLAVVIGILGLIFPILPGWIFIFIGLELLGIQILFVEKIKKFAKDKINQAKRGRLK